MSFSILSAATTDAPPRPSAAWAPPPARPPAASPHSAAVPLSPCWSSLPLLFVFVSLFLSSAWRLWLSLFLHLLLPVFFSASVSPESFWVFLPLLDFCRTPVSFRLRNRDLEPCRLDARCCMGQWSVKPGLGCPLVHAYLGEPPKGWALECLAWGSWSRGATGLLATLSLSARVLRE